jgi:formylglycine-generating enzyme required for sulfatase activity
MSHSLGMVNISAGEFWMGCHTGPCFLGSDFLHAVYLSEYFIDRYEITNAQYAGCVSAGHCAEPAASGSHTRFPIMITRPTPNIRFFTFVERCTDYQGLKRLPTEVRGESAW